MCNWEMRLDTCCGNLVLLMSFRKFSDGELLSIWWSHFPLGALTHVFFHFSLMCLLCPCFRAEVLTLSFFLRIHRSNFGLDDFPFAALFASLSISSFPSIPTCPAVHRSIKV